MSLTRIIYPGIYFLIIPNTIFNYSSGLNYVKLIYSEKLNNKKQCKRNRFKN